MNLSDNQLRWISIPLVGFFENLIKVEGEIILPFIAGTPSQLSIVFLTFAVVRVPLAYNVIFR